MRPLVTLATAAFFCLQSADHSCVVSDSGAHLRKNRGLVHPGSTQQYNRGLRNLLHDTGDTRHPIHAGVLERWANLRTYGHMHAMIDELQPSRSIGIEEGNSLTMEAFWICEFNSRYCAFLYSNYSETTCIFCETPREFHAIWKKAERVVSKTRVFAQEAIDSPLRTMTLQSGNSRKTIYAFLNPDGFDRDAYEETKKALKGLIESKNKTD
jgi:hypothetical protein